MTTIPEQPCAHPDCGCKVECAGDYCSDDGHGKGSAQPAAPRDWGQSDCLVEQTLQRAGQS